MLSITSETGIKSGSSYFSAILFIDGFQTARLVDVSVAYHASYDESGNYDLGISEVPRTVRVLFTASANIEVVKPRLFLSLEGNLLG